MLTLTEKSEIRGMRDHIQVALYNECKEYLRTGFANVGDKRVKLTTQALLKLDDLREFLLSIFAARAAREYVKRYPPMKV